MKLSTALIYGNYFVVDEGGNCLCMCTKKVIADEIKKALELKEILDGNIINPEVSEINRSI